MAQSLSTNAIECERVRSDGKNSVVIGNSYGSLLFVHLGEQGLN